MSKARYEGSDRFRPISSWGYVGYALLFAIPVVGLILLIIFSLNSSKINRRNYARSYLCAGLLAIVLCILAMSLTDFGRGTPVRRFFDEKAAWVQDMLDRRTASTAAPTRQPTPTAVPAAQGTDAEPTQTPTSTPVPTPTPAPTDTPEPTESPYTATLKRGDKGDDVAAMQARLIELGYLQGAADGSFGAKTEDAVKAFQAAMSLTQDGAATPQLQAALFAENAPLAPTPSPTPEATPTPTPRPTGVTPAFKEMMDSYEAFFDEYIAFMEKYSKSDNSLAMMTDYFNWLSKYTDYMEKLEEADDEDLSDADMEYYLEVSLRIEKKLIRAGL